MSLLTDPLAYGFFTRALVAGVAIGAMCGALSVFVVLRRMSYIGHGLAHSVLGGAAVGVALGYHLYLGAAVATAASALLIHKVSNRRGLHIDAAIGIVTTSMFAVGVAVVSMLPAGRISTDAVLFGNILGVSSLDLGVALVAGAVFTVALVVAWKPLLFTTFDPEVAAVQGVPTAGMVLLLNVLTALVVIVSVRVLGVLLVAAAVVIPAAAARLLTRSFTPLLLLATGIGVASSIGGLYASFHLDLPSGPTIVLTGTAVFIVAWIVAATGARRRSALAAGALVLALAGCGVGDGEPTAAATRVPAEAVTTPAEAMTEIPAPALSVVATVAPLADVVAQIGGDRVEVEPIVPPGVDAHTYEARPRDVARMEAADAFFGMGLGLNDAAVRLAEANLPDSAPLVLLGEASLDGEDLLTDDGHGHTHDADDGHSHSHDEDDGHSHEHNPHTWTSLRLTADHAGRVADVLAELDPEHRLDYAANLVAFRDELRALDQDIATAVDTVPPENRVLVTYHDAWGYYARDYGLKVVAAVQPSDFAEPSAGDVRAIIDQIRAEGVPAVFGAEEFPSGVVEAIARETAARYVGDLADDVLPGAPGDEVHSYTGLMATNTRVIVQALGGDPSPLGAWPGA